MVLNGYEGDDKEGHEVGSYHCASTALRITNAVTPSIRHHAAR